MALGEPVRLRRQRAALFDPAMAGVGVSMRLASRGKRRIGEELFDIGVKRALVRIPPAAAVWR